MESGEAEDGRVAAEGEEKNEGAGESLRKAEKSGREASEP